MAIIGLLLALRPKPKLKVVPLFNDSSIPLGLTNSVQGPDVPDGIGFFSVPGGSSPTSNLSQFYDLRWKAPGESPHYFNEPRFQLKFGVLKISNLPRSLRTLQLREGEAVDLEADLSIYCISHHGVPFQSKGPKWTDQGPLSWYRRGWDTNLTNALLKGDPQSMVTWAKFASDLKWLGQALHLLVRDYLRYPTLDRLPVGRDAFLLLFVTSVGNPGSAWTTSEDQLWIPGEYILRIGIYAKNLSSTEHYFSLKIAGWNDFDVRRIKSPRGGVLK
jgi:hypothetical protein